MPSGKGWMDGFDVEVHDGAGDRCRKLGFLPPIEELSRHVRYQSMVRGLVDQLLAVEHSYGMVPESRGLHEAEHDRIVGFQQAFHGPCIELVDPSVRIQGVARLDELVERSDDRPPFEKIHHLVRLHPVAFYGQRGVDGAYHRGLRQPQHQLLLDAATALHHHLKSDLRIEDILGQFESRYVFYLHFII